MNRAAHSVLGPASVLRTFPQSESPGNPAFSKNSETESRKSTLVRLRTDSRQERLDIFNKLIGNCYICIATLEVLAKKK